MNTFAAMLLVLVVAGCSDGPAKPNTLILCDPMTWDAYVASRGGNRYYIERAAQMDSLCKKAPQ